MAVTIDDLIKQCGGQNAAGVKPYIHIIHEKNVQSTPAVDVDSLIVSTPIVPVTSEGFLKWETSGVLSKNTWKVERSCNNKCHKKYHKNAVCLQEFA
mgnify:CR=1 FL=1